MDILVNNAGIGAGHSGALENFQGQSSPYHCDHGSAISVEVAARPANMPTTQDWEDGMLAYLRIITIALLAMTAISVATVATAMADIEIDSYSFGDSGWSG